jgi:hypothetical protein
MMAKWITWNRERGEPLSHGPYVVTPISGHLRLRLPYFRFVWSRPLAVEVAGADGARTLPIHDVTRRAQIGLWFLGVLTGATIWLLRRPRAARPTD